MNCNRRNTVIAEIRGTCWVRARPTGSRRSKPTCLACNAREVIKQKVNSMNGEIAIIISSGVHEMIAATPCMPCAAQHNLREYYQWGKKIMKARSHLPNVKFYEKQNLHPATPSCVC